MKLRALRPLRAALAAGLALVVMAPIASADTPTPQTTTTPVVSTTSTPAATGTAVASTTATSVPSSNTATATPAPAATATPNPSTPHDSRYFSQTGFRIDNDAFWNYFLARGGIPTFGYPTSRTFTFLGFTTQFFQRRIMQLDQNGNPRLLNLFDQGLFPYTNINGSTFPGPDPGVQGAAPVQGSDPNYSTDILNFIQNNAPNSFAGRPVDFWNVFTSQVPVQAAFPNGGDTSLLSGFDLEMWGAVTSKPAVDPANNNFIYLRFQRGIMMFDGTPGMNLTQGVLLADYFKAVITGNNIPPDLNLQAQNSPFYKQYNNSQPNGLNNSTTVPGTNMQFAFDPE